MAYNMEEKEILLSDIENMDNAMEKLSKREDIWQDRLLYEICAAIRHILMVIVKKIK